MNNNDNIINIDNSTLFFLLVLLLSKRELMTKDVSHTQRLKDIVRYSPNIVFIEKIRKMRRCCYALQITEDGCHWCWCWCLLMMLFIIDNNFFLLFGCCYLSNLILLLTLVFSVLEHHHHRPHYLERYNGGDGELVALLTTYPKVVSLVVIDAVVCWVIFLFIYIYIPISINVCDNRARLSVYKKPISKCFILQIHFSSMRRILLLPSLLCFFFLTFWVLFDEERD